MNDDRFLLTTRDNPYNPHTEWEAWYLMDLALGHDTCGLLARVAGDTDIDDGSIQQAKRDIVRFNLSGQHILVDHPHFDSLIAVESEDST